MKLAHELKMCHSHSCLGQSHRLRVEPVAREEGCWRGAPGRKSGYHHGPGHTPGRGRCASQVEESGIQGQPEAAEEGQARAQNHAGSTAGTVMASDLTILHRAKGLTRNSKATLASQAV